MGIREVGQSGIVVSGVEGVVGMMSGKLGDVRYVFFALCSSFYLSILLSCFKYGLSTAALGPDPSSAGPGVAIYH